jgi:branched-chain amino acid transport system substrate-binding protein
MDRSNRTTDVTRRGILRASAGIVVLPSLLPSLAQAQDLPAKIGTFPDGADGPSVFIGITTPLTGPYSADGTDAKLGYELAIAEINAGSAIVKKWGLADKGVMGKEIKYAVADSETKPNVAVQSQTQFIQRNKAIMITGSVSSAEAIAVEELAQREKVLNMVGLSGSNDTTGKNCQRYAFRSQPSAYMACKALGPVVGKGLGSGKKAAYLVPDYSYGHSVYDSFIAAMKPFGWTTATQQVVPLGTTDFSSALLNIANSGADVFVNIAFGADSIASTKQADQFGVLKKMKLVVPNLSSFQARDVGAQLMQGVYGTFDFWWTMEDQYPLAKDFVEAFLKKNNYHPSWGAHIGFMQTLLWAVSVERAKSFNPVAVIKTIEASKSNPYDTSLGKIWYRAEDHQLVRPVPVVLGKAPSAMKTPDDFYDVVDIVAGEPLLQPIDETGCKMGSYT